MFAHELKFIHFIAPAYSYTKLTVCSLPPLAYVNWSAFPKSQWRAQNREWRPDIVPTISTRFPLGLLVDNCGLLAHCGYTWTSWLFKTCAVVLSTVASEVQLRRGYY